METAMRLGFRRNPAAAWIDDLVAAWNAHDPIAVTDFMTNDVIYADSGLGEEYRGIDTVRDFVAGMELGFSSNYHFALEMAIVTDDAYAWE
jgi:ketosteroid isomerase-like protein